MYTILIDSSKKDQVKLIKIEETQETVLYEGVDDPIKVLKDLFQRGTIEVGFIAEFKANLGPEGSFTGLKIGAAIANTLNWAYNKEVEVQIPKYVPSKYDNE